MATGGTGTALSVNYLPILLCAGVTFVSLLRLHLYFFFPEAAAQVLDPLASSVGLLMTIGVCVCGLSFVYFLLDSRKCLTFEYNCCMC